MLRTKSQWVTSTSEKLVVESKERKWRVKELKKRRVYWQRATTTQPWQAVDQRMVRTILQTNSKCLIKRWRNRKRSMRRIEKQRKPPTQRWNNDKLWILKIRPRKNVPQCPSLTYGQRSRRRRATNNFGAPSLNADGQAVDKTLTPVNIDDKPKPAKVNDKVANNQATKDPIMPTTFSSHPSIKTFNPKDINPILDKSEKAKDIGDKGWKSLENNKDDGTTQDSNDQAQQAEPNTFFLFLSFLFFFSLFFFSLPLSLRA